MDSESYDFIFKIVLLGDSGVGKSNLVSNLQLFVYKCEEEERDHSLVTQSNNMLRFKTIGYCAILMSIEVIDTCPNYNCVVCKH